MINFIVVGKHQHVVIAVLQSIRSFTDAKCMVIGAEETKGLRWSNLCEQHSCLRFDGSDDEKFIGLVNSVVEHMPYVTLIPADCDGIRMTNRVRDRLALNITPIPDSPTLNMFDDKWQFHQFCAKNMLSVPATRLIGSKFDLDFAATVTAVGLPFVVKPVNQAGSQGVMVIRSKKQYEEAVLLNDGYQFAPLIAQAYVDGIDIDLSLLADRGQLSAFAIQQATDTEVNFVSNAYLEKVAEKLCRASAFSGVMHIDARVEKHTGKVFLLESNPRFWASLTASVWCGLNFVAESINQTPRTGGARQLIAGSSHARHPLVHPSSWPHLLSDAGGRGRLSRAMLFDLYTLGRFAQELPVTIYRYAVQFALRHLHLSKKSNGHFPAIFSHRKRLSKN